MLKGIDFSVGNGITPAEIKKAGYQFVCRYLSGGFPKDITAPELQGYLDAGLPVIFVWEVFGLMPDRNQGIADAQNAQAELDNLAAALNNDAVKTAKVFFAADSATPGHVVDYMSGVCAVIGKERAGIYGDYNSCKLAFEHGVTSYGWQTLAWSDGRWEVHTLLRQVRNDIQVGPAQCDLDEAAYWFSGKILTAKDDFGQFPAPAVTKGRRTVEFTTDGTKSLAAICAAHGDKMPVVVLRTLRHGPHPRLVAYGLAHPAGRARMPKGIRLYLRES